METKPGIIVNVLLLVLFAATAGAQNTNSPKPNQKQTPKQTSANAAKLPAKVSPVVLAPRLVFKNSESVALRNGKKVTSVVLAIANWQDFPAESFASAPNLPPDPCGPGWGFPKETRDQRMLLTVYSRDKKQTYVCHPYPSTKSLGFIRFYLEQGKPMPSGFLVVLRDRLKGTTYESNPVASPTASAGSSKS